MNEFKWFKIIIVLLLASFSVRSQPSNVNVSDFTKPIAILPPSPNAASIGRYGGIDLSMATGTSNLSVPIYDYMARDIKVPLSLFYSSNGFKVDEMSGRVGTGWGLNAGGVITRTVYGAADESSERLAVPADFPARTRGLINFMEGLYTSDNIGPHDAQPDVFSFNFIGFSGRFILDKDRKPVLLEHSNLKIEFDFTSADWNFKITDASGIQYFFGGKDASESTQKSMYGTGCGKSSSTGAKTAWYLKKIIHPKNETVTFTYTYIGTSYYASISETVFSLNTVDHYSCEGGNYPAPVLNNSACQTQLQTSGVLLQEINSTSGGKVKFTYIDRKDGNDKLLSLIEVFKPSKTDVFKSFSFGYAYAIATGYSNLYSNGDAKLNYRPFLTNFSEKSGDEVFTKNHQLAYDDIQALPPRLSYAQDHYGFFNGKANSTLIPVPSNLSLKDKFKNATANREVDPLFSRKGMLTKITYPTGGKDSIVYEGNQIYEEVTSYPPQKALRSYAFNTDIGGAGTTNYSELAYVSFAQEAIITGACFSDNSNGGDSHHDKGTVTVYDEADNVVFNIYLNAGQSYNQILYLSQGKSYKVKTNSSGIKVGTSGTILYMGGDIVRQMMNVNTGGVRVAKVISSDAVKNISNVKRYFYGKLETPDISSGGAIYRQLYEKYFRVYSVCGVGNPSNELNYYSFFSMYSNTLNNNYINASSPVSYRSVIESFGENFENGGIEHQYTVYGDTHAYQLVGTDPIMGAPMSSNSWRNGKEIYQQVFKMKGAAYIPVKRIFTRYKEDARINDEIKAYVVNKQYSVPATTDPPASDEVEEYSLATYSHYRKWVYADTTKVQNFAENGVDYTENITVNEYDNPAHALITKTTANTSDNQNLSSFYSYPQDLILSGNEEVARKSLVDKHILSPVLKTKLVRNSVQVQSNTVDYKVFDNDLTLPFSYKQAKGTGAEETRVNIDNYDNKGDVLSQSQASGPKLCYVWSYNSQFPIAEIKNADYTTIETLLGGAAAISTFRDSNPDKPTVDAFLLPLRTSALLKDAEITSYSYEPLLGITSQTDAKGQTIYYEYDSFQRLKNVKDQLGNIIKSNSYHYRN